MRFPPSFIERLRSHFLLSEIIGARIAIKKAGREYHALCPFHNEKSPSFTINDEKNFYHCFGCGEHGDAISFLMKYERLTYPETIERLSSDAGIPMPKPDPIEARRADAEKTIHDVLDAAATWFEQQLAANALPQDYLKKRGLAADTQKQFRIGYAPDGRNALHQHLLKAGFPQPLQAQAGLIILPEGGGVPYDRFRGRVMFPIRNASGKIIAFGGRLIVDTANSKLPKYLNSPETAVFKKGEMLFNLDLAKRAARERNMAVVMEGYMDVVSTAQAGVDYAVATLGTAVTPEHLRLLWQLCKEPVLCLDGDAAGKRAMARAAEIVLPLLKPGCSLRFALLPRGEDPDTYIRKHGKASFEAIVNNAQRLSQSLWESLSQQYRLDIPEGLAALEDACKKLTDKITDPTVRHDYLDYLRRQISACRQRLWDKTRTKGKPVQPRSPQVMQMMVSHQSAALDAVIRQMFSGLLIFPALLHKSAVVEVLSHLDIRNAGVDALRNALLSASEQPGIDNPDALAAYLQTQLPGMALGNMLGESLALPYRPSLTIEDAWQLWNENVCAYQLEHLQLELKELQESAGASLDEASYQRMIETQKALEKAQLSRQFAPNEPDAA